MIVITSALRLRFIRCALRLVVIFLLLFLCVVVCDNIQIGELYMYVSHSLGFSYSIYLDHTAVPLNCHVSLIL